jgi:hypothetical protein
MISGAATEVPRNSGHPHVVINHARLGSSLLGFAARQFSNKSFRNYVVANLKAHNVGEMLILYRLA